MLNHIQRRLKALCTIKEIPTGWLASPRLPRASMKRQWPGKSPKWEETSRRLPFRRAAICECLQSFVSFLTGWRSVPSDTSNWLRIKEVINISFCWKCPILSLLSLNDEFSRYDQTKNGNYQKYFIYGMYGVFIYHTYLCTWNCDDLSTLLCQHPHWNLEHFRYSHFFPFFSKRRQRTTFVSVLQKRNRCLSVLFLLLFIDKHLDRRMTAFSPPIPCPWLFIQCCKHSFYFTLALPSEQPVRCLSPGGAFIEVIKGDSLFPLQHVSRPDSG